MYTVWPRSLWLLLLLAITSTRVFSASGGASALSSSWSDLSFEKRCEGMLDFLKGLSSKELPGWALKKPRCVISGSAAGDAKWVFDVDFVKGSATETVRYIVDEPKGRKPNIFWCLFKGDVSGCASPWDNSFGVGGLFRGKQAATTAYDQLIKKLPGMLSIVTNLDAWIGRQGKSEKIFGVEYVEWVNEWVKTPRRLPIKDKEVTADFDPERENPKVGSVIFKGAMPSELRECLGCGKTACDKSLVGYEFIGMGLNLTRRLTPEEQKTSDSKIAKAAWIMVEPTPYVGKQARWHFMCGENRYNVQKI